MFQYDEKIDIAFGELSWRVKLNATFLWISGLILQIVTTLTSAYSTFNVLLNRFYMEKIKVNNEKFLFNYKYFQSSGQPPTFSYMLAFSVKIILQIVFQTMFIFLILWMTLFHERWENFRYFMIRNYSSKSVIYLCGLLILFVFIVTTLGTGFESLRSRLEILKVSSFVKFQLGVGNGDTANLDQIQPQFDAWVRKFKPAGPILEFLINQGQVLKSQFK